MNAEDVRNLLNYDPETGHLTWRVNRGGKAKAGTRAGAPMSSGYRQISLGDRMHLEHRVVWLHHFGTWPSGYLDHINGDKADNRIANLRECTQQENCANQGARKNNRHGLKGITFSKKDKRWIAQITVARKVYRVGSFKCPTAAHLAYCAEAKRRFGEFYRGA